MSKQSLKKLRERFAFSCPACLQPVQLKVGTVKIAHFSHHPSATCSSFFSENESPLHLQGKWQFQSFFEQLDYEVLLESFIPSLQQRPDLLITKNNETYAIEFQRSTIPLHHIIERTNGFQSICIPTCWIIAQPVKVLSIYTSQVVRISLTEFQQYFLHDSTFITYDVETMMFHYFSSLRYLGGNQFLARSVKLPLHLQTFPFRRVSECSNETLSVFHSKWRERRQLYLANLIQHNRRGVQHPVLRACYEMRISPLELPDYIGVPLIGAEAIRKHPVEWQLLFYVYQKSHDVLEIEAFLSCHSVEVTRESVAVVERYADFLRNEVPNRHGTSVAKT